MIWQLTENLMDGDAISDNVLSLDRALRSLGYEVGNFTNHALVKTKARVEDARHMDRWLKPGDLLLYQYSIGSALNEWFAAQHCRKAIIYQNITPARFLRPYAPVLADAALWGREQLGTIAPTLDFAFASSRYSAEELRDYGCADVTVLPLLLEQSRYTAPCDEQLLQRLGDGKKNILFVGRKAPNKRLEDVLLATDYYQKAYGRPCRVILAGDESMSAYCRALRALAEELEVELLWLGRVPFAQLLALYRGSHLFLCMSEHEGFCVPLLESMLLSLPVLAYGAAAVPETLGESGVVFGRKDFRALAPVIDALLWNEGLRREIIEGQKRRLANFSPETILPVLKSALESHDVKVGA